MQYSTLLSDLRNDSDKDRFTAKDLNIELAFQDDSHFKKFEIKFRNKESKDDVKKILSSLEKDDFFLKLDSNHFQQGIGRRNSNFQSFH